MCDMVSLSLNAAEEKVYACFGEGGVWERVWRIKHCDQWEYIVEDEG